MEDPTRPLGATPGASLASQYPAIQACLRSVMPEFWPGLNDLAERVLARPRPEALLPLAACQAAGGDPLQAIPVAAAIVATEIALIILDDLNDRDRPAALVQQVGPERAQNFAAVFQTLALRVLTEADWPPDVARRILRAFGNGCLVIAAGQDRDLAAPPHDLEAYWAIAEKKTGAGYAMALQAGALVAAPDAATLQALGTFGYHTGLAAQIFNDLRGIWSPDGATDLAQGKVTLPVVYALNCEHPDRGLLRAIVGDRQLARHEGTVREILDRIDVRAFLVWAALQHREQALRALAALPAVEVSRAGVTFLEDFVTGSFGNIETLLHGSGAVLPRAATLAGEILTRATPAATPVDFAPTPVYRSAGLALRQQLRAGPV